MKTKHETADLFRRENNDAAIRQYADTDSARRIMVCTSCGSADVCSDAAARWDVDAQDWVLSGVHDNTDCNRCGGECHVLAIRYDDADEIEAFLHRAFSALTEPNERPAFVDWLKLEAVKCEDDDDTSPRQVLAARLEALRNPPPRDVSWEFVRVGAPGPTSATYYCAADPLQAMELIEAKAVAEYLGPQWVAVRDDDGDWVFAGPFRSEAFTVSRDAAMAHVHRELRA